MYFSVTSVFFLHVVAQLTTAFAPTPVSPATTTAASRAASQQSIAVLWAQLDDLKELGFTRGLCEGMLRDAANTEKRFWVLDNSGSMATPDGHRQVIKANGDIEQVDCTRWKELQETVVFHSKVAGALGVPTEFRFLNRPSALQGDFVVDKPGDASKAMQTMMRVEPMGATPLTENINKIRKDVEKMLPKLSKEGKQVTLTIATDGLPTDYMGCGGEQVNQELGKALGDLANLPIWVVIRLCTDDEKVIDFYNDLDGRLELSMDVLDDFVGEAREVKQTNGYLTYGMPLHRFREMGCCNRLTDLIDERKLTKDELRDFTALLFGEAEVLDGMPDPQADWLGFRSAIAECQKKEELVYNPLTKTKKAWLSPGLIY